MLMRTGNAAIAEHSYDADHATMWNGDQYVDHDRHLLYQSHKGNSPETCPFYSPSKKLKNQYSSIMDAYCSPPFIADQYIQNFR